MGKKSKENSSEALLQNMYSYTILFINDDIARAEAHMWLNKSLDHELTIRGLEQEGEKDMFHNFLNIPENNPFGYCLTCIGFLNFKYAASISQTEKM